MFSLSSTKQLSTFVQLCLHMTPPGGVKNRQERELSKEEKREILRTKTKGGVIYQRGSFERPHEGGIKTKTSQYRSMCVGNSACLWFANK